MGSITAEPPNLPVCGTAQPDPIIELLAFSSKSIKGRSASISRTAELLTDAKETRMESTVWNTPVLGWP
jgi:hypothetical protein